MPFGFVPSVITAETVKAFPAVEKAPFAPEYGVKLAVLIAQPLVAPVAYAAVPSDVNEMDAEPLFSVARPAAFGFVSKSNQSVGVRPVMSAFAAKAEATNNIPANEPSSLAAYL